MTEEDLNAERIAVQSPSEFARWLGKEDPTTLRLIVEILKSEEEHAEELPVC